MNMLLRNYEMFMMKSDEIITQMFTGFTKIVNGLVNQGQIFSDVEKVNKLPRALPKERSHVRMLVQKTIRIQPNFRDKWLGTLMSYEVENPNEETSGKCKKVIAFKAD